MLLEACASFGRRILYLKLVLHVYGQFSNDEFENLISFANKVYKDMKV